MSITLLIGAGTAALLSHVPWDEMPRCGSSGCKGVISPKSTEKTVPSCCKPGRQDQASPSTPSPGAGVTEVPLLGSSVPQTLSAAAQPPAAPEQQAPQQPVPVAKEPIAQPAAGGKDANPPAVKKVELGKNVFIEIEGDKRRVVVQSYVCLRQGGLEQLLTTENGKKHESILAADMDARMIHTALLACEAKPGHPIRFQPKLEPPAGAVIKITLEYKNKDNKVVRVPAQQWIKNSKTKKDLTHDWVFAGSVLIPDPLDKKAAPFYGANSGDVICVANMDTALLDLPIESNSEGDLSFEANTERIPAENTPVLIILEPVPEKKNQK